MDEINLPRSIQVLGTWVKIVYVHEIPSASDEYLHGIFELEKDKITIRITNAQDMYRTLIHELTHAFLAYSGVGQVLNERYEESICCLFENFTKIFTVNIASRSIRWSKKRGAIRVQTKNK